MRSTVMPASEIAIPVAEMVAYGSKLLLEKMGCSGSGLVVGCGTGDEVVYMRRAFCTSRVFGVDLENRFSALARAEGCVSQGDALSLPFRSESFDFAAAYHSLEHVEDVRRALNEVWRVLRAGGWFYLGVPNRTRLLGYLGSFDATAWQKIAWNVADWRARLAGRFRNELGAHAGFGRCELAELLAERFTSVRLLTAEFLRFKYGSRLPAPLLSLLVSPKVINYSAPSHYVLCQKPG